MTKLKDNYPKWLMDEDYKEYVNYALEEKFANHKAKVAVNNKRLLLIDWCNKDGRSDYEVHYILDKVKGTFVVYGDLGEATACWYHPIELEDFLSYLHSCYYLVDKITAGKPYVIDIQLGVEQIREQMQKVEEEYMEEGEDTEELEEDLSSMVSCYEEYGEHVYANDEFNELWEKYLVEQEYDLGKKVSNRVYLWVLGFFMACDDAGLLE